MPALPAPLARYLPTDRMPIDARRKLDLIGRHRSQLDTTLEADWLSAFAKREELFFTERLRRHGHRWLQAGAKQLDADRTELDVNGFTETNTWGPAGFSAVTVRPSSSR